VRYFDEVVSNRQVVLRGTAVSSGIARGTAHVLESGDRASAPARGIEAAEVDREIARFETALARAENELVTLGKDVGERIGAGEGNIFAAQALVVRDDALHAQVVAVVRERQVNVEAAVTEVIEKFTRAFAEIPNEYLRERATDIRDVGDRVLTALTREDSPSAVAFPEGSILVADELLPSATARFELGRVRAFITDRGSKFSHTSILARSMRMPALSAVGDAALKIKTGDPLIVDGVSGVVFIHPDESVRREYDRLQGELDAYKAELAKTVDLPAVTLDGTPLSLLANVSKLSDTEAALLYKADGIGLYRTEFGFSIRSAFPTEEEQYEILELAAERVHPRRMVIRLLDVGGDKTLAYFPLPPSRNPSLGERGIRLLLKHPEVLKPQLRALLRLGAEHPVSILLPVVVGLEEVRATRAFVKEVADELTAEGKNFDPGVPIGAMIEVPSAAVVAAALAKEVDFFSLGTNDLVQYVLVADRENDSLAEYYQPLHPAVLRLIHSVAAAARTTGRPLTICGEIAGDPAYTELLVGLGLRELSVAPGEILEVKDAIRKVDVARAETLACEALEAGSVAEVEALLARRRSAEGD
jgi:phosphoenolpyruvate-protein phosphotransferase (PTS system enzyme I)